MVLPVGSWGISGALDWQHSLDRRPGGSDATFPLTSILALMLGDVRGGQEGPRRPGRRRPGNDTLLLPVVPGLLAVLGHKAPRSNAECTAPTGLRAAPSTQSSWVFAYTCRPPHRASSVQTATSHGYRLSQRPRRPPRVWHMAGACVA